MSQLSPILRDSEGNGLIFWCPGCKGAHRINHGPDGWKWNGSTTKPTFSPSVLVRNGHYLPGHDKSSCWCTFNKAHPEEAPTFKCLICHSFVVDGNIQFLSDCSHELAGQTVPLPEWPKHPEEDA